MKWIKFKRDSMIEFYSLGNLKKMDIRHIQLDEYVADFEFNLNSRRVFFKDKEKFMRNFENFVLAPDDNILELEI